MEWDELSFILSSKQREKVIKCLKNPNTPSRIAKETGVTKAHVSRILKDFMEMEIVECKTPEKRKGKIFVLTEKGKNIREKIKQK